jgi:hypothetical protein
VDGSFVEANAATTTYITSLFAYLRADRTMLWLSNLFLLFVGFIPFPPALLGAYGTRRVEVIAYGSSLVAGFAETTEREKRLVAELQPSELLSPAVPLPAGSRSSLQPIS